MSSQKYHARSSLCRNRLTRSPWAVPLLLLIASPLTRALAISGTLAFGTGCGGGPTIDECVQWRDECIALCGDEVDPESCRFECEAEHDLCLDDAYAEEERREQGADALAAAGVACLAVAVCTLEALGDGDGDGDDDWDDDWEEPAQEEDWGEDWGEQVPSEDPSLLAPDPWTEAPLDLPGDE